MKRFAHDDAIGTGNAVPSGAIELTDAEYKAALDAKLSGREAIVIDGALVIRDPAPAPGYTWQDGAWAAPPEPEPEPPTSDDVDRERDRRIDGGMVFDGVVYQTRPQDRENVAGAATLALAAIVDGAQPGDLRWHGEDTDFVWIAEDNSTHTFDAQTFFAFAQATAQHKSAHIFAARALKDTDPIPEDFANDAYWPEARQ